MSVPDRSANTVSEVRKGLEGVIAGDTAISDVDGANCRLIYRGYDIGELAGNASYEEVSYLLLFGSLPTQAQLGNWAAQLEPSRAIEPPILKLLDQLPKEASSMGILRTIISALGLYAPDSDERTLPELRQQAIRTIAQTPAIVAAIGRLQNGQRPLAPKPGLSHAANFLYMLHGAEPTPEQAQALDTYFVLLAEHGFNASTFTARIVTGTRSDYYSAISAAIGSLKGPLHGAANRKAMEMLLEIGEHEQVDSYVQKTLADHRRFMGFGHRVYKGEDPRAKHLKALAHRLGQTAGDLRWFAISERLQTAVWNAKQLYINVDFYSASLLHYLEIPTALFTAMFACARMAGWSAHVLEQMADNRLIRPLARYTGPRDLRFVPIERRVAQSAAS